MPCGDAGMVTTPQGLLGNLRYSKVFPRPSGGQACDIPLLNARPNPCHSQPSVANCVVIIWAW